MEVVPPPPPPDLNAVYRPDDDAHVRGTIVASLEEGPPARPAATFEEVLGLAPPPPAPAPKPAAKALSEEDAFEDVLGLRPQAQRPSGSLLLDLLDTPPQEASGNVGGEGSLLGNLPPGVPSPSSLDRKPTFINLSGSAPNEDQPAASSSSRPPIGGAGHGAAPGGPAAVGFGGQSGMGSQGAPAQQRAPRPIPTDAKGFGSEDLFGNGSQEKTIKDEAVAAISTVYGMLPDQVKDQAKPYIPNCMETSNQDESTEQVFSSRQRAEAPPPQSRNHAAGLGGLGAAPLETQHTQAAVDRACNGKWVPTYMRQQLVENGHVTVPTGPNAHEHSASAPPPASLGQAFAEMGDELGESAQTMLTFMIALLSSFATQCQMCTHQVASSAHEQVIMCGENMCNATDHEEQFEDHVIMGRPVSEAAAGLGPVRAQLRHHVQVAFPRLIEIAKRKLVTHDAPPEFKRAIKARELSREVVVREVAVEDWLFNTEVRKEAVPEAALAHLCRDMGPLVCHETWHVEMNEERAEVEISSMPAGGYAIVVLRLLVSSKPAAEGGGCDVESKLFVRARERAAVLPIGLVEQLSQVHQAYAESLRVAVTALAREMGADELPTTATIDPPAADQQAAFAKDSEPLPVVQLSLPEKRAPSWAADEGFPGKRAAPPRTDVGLSAVQLKGTGAVDSSLLLQVAEGI